MSWGDFGSTLAAVVTGGGISLAGQWLMSKKQHKDWISQQWWERKADAYGRIIDSMWHGYSTLRELNQVDLDGRDESDERVQAFRAKLRAGSTDLRRATDLGAFLISDEAEQILRNCRTDMYQIDIGEEGYFTNKFLEENITVISKYLYELREAAKKDLKVVVPENRRRRYWWS